jgi:hypothetical protein
MIGHDRLHFMCDSDAADEAAYRAIKTKYQELKNLRTESVLADSADLRQKIEEHQRLHDSAVSELGSQNDELRRLIHLITNDLRKATQCRFEKSN